MSGRPTDAEVAAALHQYRSDLFYPVASDSRDRRVAMIDNLISRLGAAK